MSIRTGPICDENTWIRVSSRDQSGSIALKREFLAVDLTVSSEYAEKKSLIISCLYVPETIE